MTNTPETDVRTALNEAATITGLGFDEAAVLSRGHRVVRRRRVVAAGAGVAAAALATVVALQVSGNGFNRALPPASNPTSTVIAVAGPVDETGEVVPGTDEAGVAQGFGARLSVRGGAGGRVVETWTVTEAGKPVKTLTREAGLLGVGRASLLLPAESGIPDLVLGYVNTGSDRSISAGINTAPEQLRRGGGGDTHLTGVSGATRRHDHLFVEKYDAFDPSKIVGLSWGETNDADPARLKQRSILLNTERTDLVAAVLTEPSGDQWISWASATQIGLASSMGQPHPGRGSRRGRGKWARSSQWSAAAAGAPGRGQPRARPARQGLRLGDGGRRCHRGHDPTRHRRDLLRRGALRAASVPDHLETRDVHRAGAGDRRRRQPDRRRRSPSQHPPVTPPAHLAA